MSMFDDHLSGLRVGLDMDGVLADFNTGWMRRYNRDFDAKLEASVPVFGDLLDLVPPDLIDTMLLAAKGSIWVTRPAMVHYATPRAKMLEMASELFDLVLAGKIVSEPGQSFALADAAEAHRALEGRRTVGSTVLIP